jgi:hypothetical protein
MSDGGNDTCRDNESVRRLEAICRSKGSSFPGDGEIYGNEGQVRCVSEEVVYVDRPRGGDSQRADEHFHRRHGGHDCRIAATTNEIVDKCLRQLMRGIRRLEVSNEDRCVE